MRKGFVIAAVFVLCTVFMVGTAPAQLEALNSLDFYAVQKVGIAKKQDGYWADVVTILKNTSDMNFRLRNFKFDMSFEYPPKEKAKAEEGKESKNPEMLVLQFGTSDVAKVDISKASDPGKPNLTEMPMSVFLGPDNEDTVKRILQFISLVGDPGEQDLKTVLKGKGEIGTQVEKGWIYQGNMILELKLTPELQRSWLLK